MKRSISVIVCLSIFYVAAVGAFEGCVDLTPDVHSVQHGEKSSHTHHTAGTASHHSRTDSSKIHCPNIFGEFLISSRAVLVSDHGRLDRAPQAEQSATFLLSSVIYNGFAHGPPEMRHSHTFPRHLFLSVIRI